jgi:predicted nucleic acid-binding protein
MALRYAVDTNVLLRLSHKEHPQHELIATALRRLVARQVELCFTPQNLGEFWNVSTRPRERNGLGLSIEETESHVGAIERRMTILQEEKRVYLTWRRLLLAHNVRGVQVHDAHLAAVLEVHEVAHLLTFNGPDFRRFTNVSAVHPQDVAALDGR